MNDSAVVVATDLDRLAERVERAAALITDLRGKHGALEAKHTALESKHSELERAHALLTDQHEKVSGTHTELHGNHTKLSGEFAQLQAKYQQLEQEHAALQKSLTDTQGKLQGQDPTALLNEVAALKKEQRDWLNERKEVATRIEAISAKLERIE